MILTLALISGLLAVGQLAFNIWQTLMVRAEHRARLADEQRMTADEARMAADEKRLSDDENRIFADEARIARDEKKIKHATNTKHRDGVGKVRSKG